MKTTFLKRQLKSVSKEIFDEFRFEKSSLACYRGNKKYLAIITFSDLADFWIQFSFEFALISIAKLFKERIGFYAISQDRYRSAHLYDNGLLNDSKYVIKRNLTEEEAIPEIYNAVHWIMEAYVEVRKPWDKINHYHEFYAFLYPNLDEYLSRYIGGMGSVLTIALLTKIFNPEDFERIKMKIRTFEHYEPTYNLENIFDNAFNFMDNSSSEELLSQLKSLES